MPRGNGTGPAGMGPMTGRAAGFCAGYDRPGYANSVGGGGLGFGRGRGGFGRGGGGGGGGFGWGRGNRFFAAGAPMAGVPMAGAWGGGAPAPEMAPVDEQQALKNHAEILQTQLDAVSKRLEQIDAK